MRVCMRARLITTLCGKTRTWKPPGRELFLFHTTSKTWPKCASPVYIGRNPMMQSVAVSVITIIDSPLASLTTTSEDSDRCVYFDCGNSEYTQWRYRFREA